MIKMGMTNVEFAQAYDQWKNFQQDTSIPAFSNFVEAQYNQARIDWLVKNHFEGTEFDVGYLRDVFAGHYDEDVQVWLDTPEEEPEVIHEPEQGEDDWEEYVPEPEILGASYLDN